MAIVKKLAEKKTKPVELKKPKVVKAAKPKVEPKKDFSKNNSIQDATPEVREKTLKKQAKKLKKDGNRAWRNKGRR